MNHFNKIYEKVLEDFYNHEEGELIGYNVTDIKKCKETLSKITDLLDKEMNEATNSAYKLLILNFISRFCHNFWCNYDNIKEDIPIIAWLNDSK